LSRFAARFRRGSHHSHRSLCSRFGGLWVGRGHDFACLSSRSQDCGSARPAPGEIGGSVMKTAEVLCTPAPALARSRVADYLELAKLRISVMVLITVAAGAILATVGPVDWLALCQTLLGTAFVATGASALNQLLERDSDALMRRTESRPLPAGRLL